MGEAVAPLVGEALGRAVLDAINQRTEEDLWRSPQPIREELLDWYRNEGVVALQPWARQKENGAEIPDGLKAWRVFLGELLVNQIEEKDRMNYWPWMLKRWPDHEAFLYMPQPIRRRHLRNHRLEKNEALLEQVAIQLKEGLEWREWVRTDLKGLGRDRIRQCLAMVGITTDRSCSIGLGRMVGRINGKDASEQLLSRQRRELNLGLLLGGDQDGRIYRAAVAVAERWCLPEALCDGGLSVNSNECPLCASRSCQWGQGYPGEKSAS